ncbi:uncharacterized protein Dana_GF27761 [Drosophila ananassae]|uniref:Uncharacterized protein n=1 Tax=Drosophila ananassae TaxID=7217 RepID=A0A0N8P167_DROAN|nr:uncharacterized protein Dana_GF27761 [Drosophila ananassae]
MRAGYQSLAHSQSRLIIHSAHVSIPHLTVLFNKQKPHKSQPASTPKLMGVARPALLIYQARTSANADRGVEGGKSTGWRLFK